MLFRGFLVQIIILFNVHPATFDGDPEATISPSEFPDPTALQPSTPGTPQVDTWPDGVGSISIEILRVILPPGIGNAVKLVWGRKLDDMNLNITYGVHYAKDGEELTAPKLLTTNESAVVEDLEFCTKYNFAVTITSNDGAVSKISPNDLRSVVTLLDLKAAPKDLKVDFEPRELPCLLIRWSASCPNIGQPVVYIISAFEQNSSRYTIVTLPASKREDFVYHFKVSYGAKFDIKVSTNSVGSQATETVTYKVPSFLQPYKVRVTSNPDGAFMIYWQEPYVPYYVDRVYYEVYVYQGTNISSNYEKYYVTRPVLVYKGNASRYTFSVGLVSYDGQYRSLLSDPIAADIYGDNRQIGVH
ncbi:unnamed protein product [Phaedon cochleariae]|uniref:Fibronectin type III domain protein n=1 Tax=Phaedon cochleariae TaxID=80249 RepID=A0A9P0GJW6_PHACE|nr:unnamed protein product [Phaedon cochleariae]